MDQIRRELRQRTRDILSYLRMLRFIDVSGPVSLQSRTTTMVLKQETTHVLKAGVFLHLYNLVEATVTSSLEFVAEQIALTNVAYRDLDLHWQRAWARSFGKLDENLTADKRLIAALKMCQAVADGLVMQVAPKIGAGNLDDRRIEELAKRYGIQLALRPSVQVAVKYQVLNDLGFLGLVRERRNGLAHGHESFSDIGKNYSTTDLARWSWATYQYLKDLVASFESYVAAQSFRRAVAPPPPVAGASSAT